MASSQSEPLTVCPKSRSGDCPPFFLAGSNGSVYYADDMGHCSESASVNGSILSLMLFEYKDMVLVINEDFLLSQYSLSPEGRMTREIEVKLSTAAMTDKPAIQCCWVGLGMLALCFGGSGVRIWDLLNGENYSLSLPGMDKIRITCIAYNVAKNLLAGGTDSGHVLMWRFRSKAAQGSESAWELLPKVNAGGNVESVSWGCSGTIMAVRRRAGLNIFTNQVMHRKLYGRKCAVQVAPSRVLVDRSPKPALNITTDLRIKGLALTNAHVAIWDGKSVAVYEYSDGKHSSTAKPIGQFASETLLIALNDNALYRATGHTIDVCQFHGSIKQTVATTADEGEVVCLDAAGNYLTVATSRNYLKLFDTSRRELRYVATRVIDRELNIQSIVSAQSNPAGTFVSFFGKTLIEGASHLREPDPRLFLYDVDQDRFSFWDFHDENLNPISTSWDFIESRLLLCEAEGADTSENNEPHDEEEGLGGQGATSSTASRIFAFFATSEKGIILQETYNKPDDAEALVGIAIPLHYFVKKADPNAGVQDDCLLKRITKDYAGVEETDTVTLRAMSNFQYHLAIGNIDEAFKSIKIVNNTYVWENLAKMCVKMKNLQVARLCLGKIGNARALRAIGQEGIREDELAQLAVIGIYLGLDEEVRSLCKEADRWDILNTYCQSLGQWEESLALASKNDRIALKSTFYRFGRHLEDTGDTTGAIAAYEKSSVFGTEVPRMLLASGRDVGQYVAASDDKSLSQWWAQYLESTGDVAGAISHYERAGDTLSLVRVLCYAGAVSQAMTVAEQSGNIAALYHIARYYESEDKTSEAINYYAKAKCFNQAIRLAKEKHVDRELMHLALQGTPEAMIDAARYYEKLPEGLDKAITLYQKSGNFSRALELCFQTKQFGILDDIAQSMDTTTDPIAMQRCADFFLENGQYDKAVKLLTIARRYDEVLDLCMGHSVTLTEDMANAMVLPEEGIVNRVEAQKGLDLRVGDVLMGQGNYHLACKKYNQAGDRYQAMKALLKSGDVEKIMYFANVCGPKQRDIFVIAANFLQTLDWRNDPSIMKAIVTFYTKAKAFDSLAGFYEACAQVEIDEYQNYEKAAGALREAMKCLSKSKNPADSARKDALEHRMQLIGQFVEGRKLAKTDTVTMFQVCENLLGHADIDEAVRVGDIYALMVETHWMNGYREQAVELLNRMRGRIANVPVEYYVDPGILRELVGAFGGDGGGGESGEEIEEEIE
ncbi:hypothetical protein HK097_011283 [Rhizophlyctis rosea]|uniref:Intraflagellar transport protein 140 n=1 Tax=Rhizophlyctis rosea TaxID=64517 RepID=A0AAD5S8Z8_9FUNG|nr:hypothetical protein HK097_011283 [Rhizophlyctis rosea]